MTVDVVVSRYGEDLGWLQQLPDEWQRIVYDKTGGGARDDRFRTSKGPRGGEPWPSSILRPNVGCEAETYLHHLSLRYTELADVMVFLQGDAPRHVSNIVEALTDVLMWTPTPRFLAFGPKLSCDLLGRPHHPEGLPEILQMAAPFGINVPDPLPFVPWALFVATRETLQSVSRQSYRRAATACRTKRHACGMERLWGLLLDPARAAERGTL